jgi:hypothetical protein
MKKQIISKNVIDTLMKKNNVDLTGLIPQKLQPVSEKVVNNLIENPIDWSGITAYQILE